MSKVNFIITSSMYVFMIDGGVRGEPEETFAIETMCIHSAGRLIERAVHSEETMHRVFDDEPLKEPDGTILHIVIKDDGSMEGTFKQKVTAGDGKSIIIHPDAVFVSGGRYITMR